ncbi:terminase large subunit domain-containing protein [Brevundimonas sp.]|uniref:terminase large subunit domain-containing protein n=1 Tax=Brevundimonas sp. TaxID=1871086 RepID=UPI003D6D8CFE
MAFDGEIITEAQWAEARRAATQAMPAMFDGKALPDILMPSQKALLKATATHNLVVSDKSRRIGFTWAVSADAVLTSAKRKADKGMDTLYIGYNLDMAREFIDTCAMWAKAFDHAATEVSEFVFADGPDKDIKAFRIAFASGFEIVALSSRPRSLRGKQGYVILDEFAFHDDPDGLLKAAMALLIWGGKVLVISTHNGEDNAFNVLLNDIRAKKRPGAVVRCTFDQALEEGLYQRVCLMTGKEWSPEAEAQWRSEIRAFYGADAAEELDCVPSQGSGIYLSRAVIEACSTAGGPEKVLRLACPPGFDVKPVAERRSYIDAFLEQSVAPQVARLDKNLRHTFGQDFALTGDVSSIAPVALERNLVRTVPFVIEMRNVPYDQQKQVLFWLVERLPRFSGGKLDATGNGATLAQETKQKFGSGLIEEVKLSQDWYLNNMPPLKAAFEDRTIAIPAHSDLTDDMRQVRMIRGVPKVPDNAHTKGTDGLQRHGDFAVSLCLAYTASCSDPITYGGYEGLPGRHAPEPATDEDGQTQPACLQRAFAEADETRRGGAW